MSPGRRSARPTATAQLITPRIGSSLALSVIIGVAITWVGLALAYFYNRPVGFYITALAFGVYARFLIEEMLPEMAWHLQLFWADFTASGGGSFGDYLAKRPEEVSEELLKVTDNMANLSQRAAVVKAREFTCEVVEIGLREAIGIVREIEGPAAIARP